MSDPSTPLRPAGEEVRASIEQELNEFNRFFRSLQNDGIGMSQVERSAVRDYLIWSKEGRPETLAHLRSSTS